MSTAKALYEELKTARSTVLDTARRCAALTIPSLIPPEGANSTTKIAAPFQALGAYGVNNLAAKLLLALYPQGTSFFRYIIPEEVSEASAIPPGGREAIEKKLASIENRALQRFETSVIRPQKAEALTHLIVAGNVLTCFKSLTDFRLFRLDQYVCRRDASGIPMDVVVHERISVSLLDPETIEACGIKQNTKQPVDVYTKVEWVDGQCKWFQEINGKVVPESEGHAPSEVSPWNPLRWKSVPSSDYGRGHCEEYLGDLLSLEGLSQAVVELAAVAAKVVLLVRPGSSTDVGDINRAQSGDAVAGQADDVHVLQLEKYADFQVVNQVIQRLEERLSRAFLLRSGMIRDAERVTAEEIRSTAQELEDTLGGVYTVLAQEEQFPFVRRLLLVLTKSKDIPALPKGVVEPLVVTGFQALGRNHALNRLRGFVGDMQAMFGPDAVLRLLNGNDVATRLALGWGVESAQDLVKSKEQIAQEDAQRQQDAMRSEMISKGTAPAVAGAMKNQ